jgi:putative RecB family exonuclease
VRVACIRKPTTPALHLGKTVHAALREFHLARWRGRDDSPETIAAAYNAAFDRLEAWLPGMTAADARAA